MSTVIELITDILAHGPLSRGQISAIIEYVNAPCDQVALFAELETKSDIQVDVIYRKSDARELRQNLDGIIGQLSGLLPPSVAPPPSSAPPVAPPTGSASPVPGAPPPSSAPTGMITSPSYSAIPPPVPGEPLTGSAPPVPGAPQVNIGARTCTCATFVGQGLVCDHLRDAIESCWVNVQGSSAIYKVDILHGICSCPDYQFRGGPTHICKHLLQVIQSPLDYGLTQAELTTIASRVVVK